MDDDLYPFAFKATVSSAPALEARINAWLVEQGLRKDLDYEVQFFQKLSGDGQEPFSFDLLSTTYIFDSKAHAVMFKLKFGGAYEQEAA